MDAEEIARNIWSQKENGIIENIKKSAAGQIYEVHPTYLYMVYRIKELRVYHSLILIRSNEGNILMEEIAPLDCSSNSMGKLKFYIRSMYKVVDDKLCFVDSNKALDNAIGLISAQGCKIILKANRDKSNQLLNSALSEILLLLSKVGEDKARAYIFAAQQKANKPPTM